jgi:hypothetical protein
MERFTHKKSCTRLLRTCCRPQMLESNSLHHLLLCSPNAGCRHCTEQAQGEVCTKRREKKHLRETETETETETEIARTLPRCMLCSRIALHLRL